MTTRWSNGPQICETANLPSFESPKALIETRYMATLATFMTQYESRLNALYGRKESSPWQYEEQSLYWSLCRRPDFEEELASIEAFRGDKWFPSSLPRLLQNWTHVLDRSRAKKLKPAIVSRPPPPLPGKEQDEATLKRMAEQVSKLRKTL